MKSKKCNNYAQKNTSVKEVFYNKEDLVYIYFQGFKLIWFGGNGASTHSTESIPI